MADNCIISWIFWHFLNISYRWAGSWLWKCEQKYSAKTSNNEGGISPRFVVRFVSKWSFQMYPNRSSLNWANWVRSSTSNRPHMQFYRLWSRHYSKAINVAGPTSLITDAENKRLWSTAVRPSSTNGILYIKFHSFGGRIGSIFLGNHTERSLDLPVGSVTPISGPDIL